MKRRKELKVDPLLLIKRYWIMHQNREPNPVSKKLWLLLLKQLLRKRNEVLQENPNLVMEVKAVEKVVDQNVHESLEYQVLNDLKDQNVTDLSQVVGDPSPSDERGGQVADVDQFQDADDPHLDEDEEGEEGEDEVAVVVEVPNEGERSNASHQRNVDVVEEEEDDEGNN